MPNVELTFLGAAGTVTGSKYLVDDGTIRLLVDCGLFQGFKQLRLRNWASLPIDPASVDAVILTHAHIDHSGYLPLLVRNGFTGPVISTPATHALCEILLPDSGYLQEKDADYANRHGFSKHAPALPLYTRMDAERALENFKPVSFNQKKTLGGFSVELKPDGHILGAANVELRWKNRTLVFSGDLGRFDHPFMNPPTMPSHADYLVVESTYGDRQHDPAKPEDALEDIIVKTAGQGGSIIIPSFAVGRAQEILFHLYQLKQANRIPDIPIYLDSPMAIDASDIFCRFTDNHRLSREEARAVCSVATYTREASESQLLDNGGMPKVIISASGMATGGRILHHIKHLATDHRNALVFVGFQAGGTRGEALVAGAKAVKIHGKYVNIAAKVYNLSMLSAHADGDDLMHWLGNLNTAPRKTFITHGEPNSADRLRQRIEETLSWNCHIPEYRETVVLD